MSGGTTTTITTTLTPISTIVIQSRLDDATNPTVLCPNGSECAQNQAAELKKQTDPNYSAAMLANEDHPDPDAQDELEKIVATKVAAVKSAVGDQAKQFDQHVRTYRTKYYAQYEMNQSLVETTQARADQAGADTSRLADEAQMDRRHVAARQQTDEQLTAWSWYATWAYLIMVAAILARQVQRSVLMDGILPTSAEHAGRVGGAVGSMLLTAVGWLLLPYVLVWLWKRGRDVASYLGAK